MGLTNILAITGLIFILYFSFNAANEDGNTDFTEFLKLAGILGLLSIFLGIFIAIAFVCIQSVAWIFIYLLNVIKNDIFTMRVGCTTSLLLINAGGAYMLWEQIKEKKEEKTFREETVSSSPPPTPESDTDKEESPANVAESSENENSEEALQYQLTNEIGLSHRISKILAEAGINTVEQLTSISEKELRNTKNIGEKSLEDIKGTIEKNGLSLKRDE